MIVTYCTENYYRWAPLFLRSWKSVHGDSEKICVNGCNLDKTQITELKTLYSNLIVDNEKMDFKELCKKLNITLTEFEKCRIDVAEGFKASGGNSSHLMNFFADDHRIKRLYKTIVENPGEEYFWHFDVDVIFRGQIVPPDPDFAGKIQDVEEDCRKMPITVLFLRNVPAVVKMVKDWCDLIDSVPLESREITNPNKKAWGQYTFYHAYLKNKDNLSTIKLPLSYTDSSWLADSQIWSANKRLSANFQPVGCYGNKTNTHRFFENEVNK